MKLSEVVQQPIANESSDGSASVQKLKLSEVLAQTTEQKPVSTIPSQPSTAVPQSAGEISDYLLKPGYAVTQLIDKLKTSGELDAAVRAAGLDTRAVLEGLASLPLAVADAGRHGVNTLGHINHAITGQEDFEYLPKSYQQTFNEGLTELGLPQPETDGEHLVSAITRGGASAAGGIGAGQLLQKSSTTAARGIGDTLVTSPSAQTVAGASGGGAGELARQAGAGPEVQLAASLAAGIAGGVGARSLDAPTPQTSFPPGTATNAADAAALRETGEQAESIAQAGAEKIGLNWSSLDDNIKNQILKISERATAAGSDLPPEALARAAVYESLGIKPTRALITRSFDDALSEQNLLTENEGHALRNIYAQNNQAIRSQLQTLKPDDTDAIDLPSFGQQFRAPIVEGGQSAQKSANQAYEQATAVEGSKPTNITRLNDFLHENAGTLDNRPATSGLVDDLKKMGLMQSELRSAESGVPKTNFSLKNLASARAAVNEAWATAKNTGDARAANRLSEMRKIMDEMEAEAGGELYNAYRKLRIKKGEMYEDNPLIDKLLSDQKGYYGTAAIEDSQVFDKAVLDSSPEQFRKVWPLLTGNAKSLTRAQVAKYIEDKTFSNMATNEQGDVVASAAKLNKALNDIGPEKLQTVFGKEKAEALNRLNTAVREISSPPRGTVPQGSAPKLVFRMNLLMKGLGMVTRIPLAGDLAKGITSTIEKGAASKANEAAAVKAITPIPMRLPAKPENPSSTQFAVPSYLANGGEAKR